MNSSSQSSGLGNHFGLRKKKEVGTEVKVGEGMKKEGGEQRSGKKGKWFHKETRKWVILQSQAPFFFLHPHLL